MRLLKTVVQDFQAIKEVSLEHGDLTVITGQSDVGKSALLRSIHMLHRNSGTSSMVKEGQKSLKVFQKFDTGDVVGIEKGDGVNKYLFKKDGHPDRSLAKVGKEVPQDVVEILQSGKLVVDKDQDLDLNFALQFDPPFLISESQTLTTKTISALSGINIIYMALREASTQSQRIKAKTEVLKETEDSLKRFEGLSGESEKLEKTLSTLAEINSKLDAEATTIQILKIKQARLGELSKISIDPKPLTSLLEPLEQAHSGITAEVSLIDGMKSLLTRFLNLKNIGDVETLSEKIGKLQDILNGMSLEAVSLERMRTLLERSESSGYYISDQKMDKAEFYLQEAEQAYRSAGLCLVFHEKLENLRDTLKKKALEGVQIEKDMADLVAEDQDLASKIKLCPACGKAL